MENNFIYEFHIIINFLSLVTVEYMSQFNYLQ